MFTVSQIKEAHAKTKTGADYPQYIADIRTLGVRRYETFVADGHTQYFGDGSYSVDAPAAYPLQIVTPRLLAEEFSRRLSAHQRGETSYPTFCADCAELGIDRWEVDLLDLTCTYYSAANEKVLVETIPSV